MPHITPRVNFLIAGTQKGGTTALAHFLAQHPHVFISRQKELHFFDRDKYFRARTPNYTWYHQHFQGCDGYRAVGEATPIYMFWPAAAPRIHAYNPAMKLILLLRNPIERAYSDYIMERRRGFELLPFRWAIRVEPLRRRWLPSLLARHYLYTSRGFYSQQIQHLLHYFPREQMLILKTEELREDHYGTLQRVCAFLGVDPFPAIKQEIVFSNEYAPMSLDDWQLLQRIFAQEIDTLEALLGWDCSSWRRPPSPSRTMS
ncbi:MAG: sulfotransferase domain-containing protein [bacterium]|nr:sulfotransferase domain-containing protein [bacterium]